jgi:serine protease
MKPWLFTAVSILAMLQGCGGADPAPKATAETTAEVGTRSPSPTVALAATPNAITAQGSAFGAFEFADLPSASPGALLSSVISSKTVDLDGDGNGDLLWVNEKTGQTSAWLMNGVTAKQTALLLTHPDFRVVATGDLDGDGKTDLIWQNARTGQTTAWLMNGAGVRVSVLLLSDPNFRVVAVADFNGDGRADLVWHNSATGQTALWLMNGTSVISSTLLLTHPDFKVAATPDLNGDGKADLIWYNARSGQTSAWLMSGTSVTSSALLLTHPEFRVVATPDTNGDRRADLVWYNAASGETVLWLMNGLSMTQSRLLLAHPSFKLVATPDLNGDGRSDLVWYSPVTGQTTAWLMDGLSPTTSALLLTHPSFSVIASPRLNADSRSDLVWYSPVTGETVSWLMNGTLNAGAALALRDTFFRLSNALTASRRNSPPSALAGDPQRVTLGAVTTLDGSRSSDVDGDALSYRWTITSAPAGSSFLGQGATGARVTFTPDVAGAYTANVAVSDGLESSVATTTITASAAIPSGGWTIGGVVTVPENSAVDSDTSNAFQANRRRNNPSALAQNLPTPVQLLGSVNEPFSGSPDAADYIDGDEDDYFNVDLQPGQTVELDFATDPKEADLDLYLVDTNTGNVVGQSVGVRRYECVRVAQAGRYRVLVTAFSGASIYSLRIGAVGEAGNCVNSTSAGGSIVAGQVMAKASRPSSNPSAANAAERARALARAGQLDMLPGALDTAYPALLSLPAPGAQRRSALQQLTSLATGTTAGRVRIASATSAHRAAQPAVSGPSTAQSGPNPPLREAALQAVVDTVAYAKQLAASGAFEYAEPVRLEHNQALVGAYPPNDRSYPLQRWHYEMLQLPAAMTRLLALPSQPTRRPLVAVIDTGVFGSHPDLAPQIEDGFSFISVNRAGDNNQLSPEDPATNAERPSWHGSHVSGTVAAQSFDGVGAAGVAPMATLMPLRVFASSGRGVGANSYDITQAILYAAGLDNGSGRRAPRRADVINLSLGSGGACPTYYQDVITQALAQGTIVVVAAGNDARNDQGLSAPVGSPANCLGVIAVAALDAGRKPSYYSNSGTEIKVAAPGGDSNVSTTGNGAVDAIYSTTATFDANGARQASVTGLQGTSMAAPHVAGVMALMRYVNPAITPAQIQSLFTQGRLTVDVNVNGFDTFTGYGLIDSSKAIDAALELAGGSPPPAAGVVLALPSSIDFGAIRTDADIELRLSGASSERVLSVTSSSPAISVAATSVDAVTRLGSYRLAVNRSALTVGTLSAKLTVVTTARTFSVPLSVQKTASGASTADLGRVYVLALDPVTGKTLAQASVNASNGRYTWSISGLKVSTVNILAGTDTNSDNLLCDQGEACGAYPNLSSSLPVIEVNSNMNNLDFTIAPIGSVGAAAASTLASGAQIAGAAGPGIRRQPEPTPSGPSRLPTPQVPALPVTHPQARNSVGGGTLGQIS